ncbi:RsmB/NOP family class I SAM-dependent RNA methyltransferase [Nocardioides caldifontis]|uniref:RsmB/NOP family class I SAM-dependent RNA methyltransferase n=1 Tax=Nocardioides caldifontis TaxID=2588938 RepID=UPI0011E0286B|nr:transcription antitermination factor NusB [Nocardioides caldifontis]
MADPRSRPARDRRRRAGGRPPRPRVKADPPRLAALEVLRAVAEQDAYANLLLPARLEAHGLTGRDAAFTTELVSGTLRRQGTYDAVIAACARRPVTKLQPAVLDVLRLGAHQLLAMRVPAHAAVATSVELVRATVGQGPSGLVNAVLRRVGEQPLDAWVRAVAPDPAHDPHGFAAVAHSHPRWAVDALAEALGDRSAELETLLANDNDPPRVTLVARPGLATTDELLAAGAAAATYSPWAVVLPGGDPGALPAVQEARAGVQDEGSQLVALALTRAEVDGPDQQWLDLCAGPGGKAALLAAVAAGRGGHLLAVERQPHRAGLVVGAARAVPEAAVDVVTADGTVPAWPPGSFDRVLVDAPCSGLGALRRRPESRWRRRPEDLPGLVALQDALVRSAVDSVRPGGVVLYATCSPVVQETGDVVRRLLDERQDVTMEDAGGLLPEVGDAAGPVPGTLQLWPHRHGTDAMFLALLRRR